MTSFGVAMQVHAVIETSVSLISNIRSIAHAATVALASQFLAQTLNLYRMDGCNGVHLARWHFHCVAIGINASMYEPLFPSHESLSIGRDSWRATIQPLRRTSLPLS